MKKIIFLLLLFFATAAQAADLNYDTFRTLPILHDGRVKPLESFARIYLLEISGAPTLPDESTPAWLAETLFNPAAAMQRPIFRIDQAPIIAMLKLSARPDHLYSYAEVTQAFEAQHDTVTTILKKPADARSTIENDFITRYAAAVDFFQLLNATALIAPSHITVTPNIAKLFNLPDNNPTALQLLAHQTDITARLNHIRRAKGERIKNYNADEKTIAKLAFYLTNVQMISADNHLFRTIPSAWGDQTWYAPWELISGGHGAPQSIQLLSDWQKLVRAYNAQDPTAWQTAATAIQTDTAAQTPIANWKLKLETYYQILNPIPVIAAIYTLAFLCFTVTAFRKNKLFTLSANVSLLTAAAIHGATILARMLILGRPPVSSLYESMLYVSFIIVALSLIFMRRRAEFLSISALLAAAILAISPVYAPQGDTMNVLIAVLNTNFWLATHVICITTGYGTTLIAGTLAHVYLFRPSPRMAAWLRRITLFALLFTALGTLLGGVWADQSWGRFWGWDPKENGALLIVLWLIWVLHGRMTAAMHDRAFAAWLAGANIVVALSWFGVNLLGIGLHSYGFTNAAAWGLGAFCGGEIIIIAALYILASLRLKSQGVSHAL